MRTLFWLAVIPSIILALRVLAYDRIEKEPPALLAKLFVLGMLTCIPSAIVEAVGDVVLAVFGIEEGTMVYSVLTYLLVVPCAEECFKYLALRTTRNNPEFNYTFDGVVYAVMVGLGFATLENLLYVFEYMDLQVAIMRGLLSVPLHCTCAIFMGYFFGVARGQEVRGSQDEARRARMLALLVPILIHGIYDFSFDIESTPIFILGLMFSIAVFLLAARQVHIASANDAPIMVSLNEITQPVPHEGFGLSSFKDNGTPPPPFNE